MVMRSLTCSSGPKRELGQEGAKGPKGQEEGRGTEEGLENWQDGLSISPCSQRPNKRMKTEKQQQKSGSHSKTFPSSGQVLGTLAFTFSWGEEQI